MRRFAIVRGSLEGGFTIVGPYEAEEGQLNAQLDATIEMLRENYDPEEIMEVVSVQDPEEVMPAAEAIEHLIHEGADLRQYGIHVDDDTPRSRHAPNSDLGRSSDLFAADEVGSDEDPEDEESDVDLTNPDDPRFV